MADTLTSTSQHRLLGHPADLAGHVGSLGPLPTGSNPDWPASFWSELSASGLAGRGGAAFPAALKLATTSHHPGPGVVVVNGMEGEPASHKDKVLLIRSPHLVLDGALLLARASGARRIVVCVPMGRDQIAEAVQRAVSERDGAAYSTMPVTLVRPPDRFVAGEESALSEWIASGRSLPSYRPDKAIPLRLGRERVLVHNAETLAHIALIGRFGAAAFRSRGLPEEPGTMLITISGSVAQPGVIEVPCGTPLNEVVARGNPTSELQALLVGGYAGAWVPPQHFTTPYASIPLRTIGATAGVGVVIALGADRCGICETARIARYMAAQSSGQCGPCTFGLPAIADDLFQLSAGRTDPQWRERIERRLGEVDGRGACRHPDGVVRMVRSALDVFAPEVEAHQSGVPCIDRQPRPADH
jgi:NADH:ubiquinone oxidoreductase subunit F (NADH-binding)